MENIDMQVCIKKQSTVVAIVTLLVFALSLIGDAQEPKRYDGSWESLQKMPVPAWFGDGKIGIFIHWGPYSAIGYKDGESTAKPIG